MATFSVDSLDTEVSTNLGHGADVQTSIAIPELTGHMSGAIVPHTLYD